MRVADGVGAANTDVGAAEAVWSPARGGVAVGTTAGGVVAAVVLGDAEAEGGAAAEVGANGAALCAGAALLVTSGVTGASLLGSPCEPSTTTPASAARARAPISNGPPWCRSAPCGRFALCPSTGGAATCPPCPAVSARGAPNFAQPIPPPT